MKDKGQTKKRIDLYLSSNVILFLSIIKEMKSMLDLKLLETMKKSTKALKKFLLIETRSKIEFEKYKITEEPPYTRKYIASFYIFVIMLGYMDKKIDEEKSNLVFWEHMIEDHSTCDSRTASSIEKISKYSTDRDEIVTGFNTIIDRYHWFSYIHEVIETSPSCVKFDSLYKDHRESHGGFYITQHLINAYNLGYSYNDMSYEELMGIYRQLYEELLNEKNRLQGLRNKQLLK